MNLLRFGVAGLLLLPLFAGAQSAPPAFYDVASIKPHDANDQNMNWQENEDGFRIVNVGLKNVIAAAWDLRPDQVSGEPSWVNDLPWDITGKSTEQSPEQLKKLTPAQRNEMMQQLLAERFHLKAHLESRTGPVFTLSPAKGGLKLTPIAMTPEQKAAGKVPGSGLRISGGTTVVMEAKDISLAQLMANLAYNLSQTVIDKTGLPPDAVYRFTLRWASDEGAGLARDSDGLREALEDQLGIRLEASKGPVKVLVVDHVEKPTAN